MCVQNFNDSRGIAIRMTYRISLRSSSLWEPRHPLLKVVKIKRGNCPAPESPASPTRQSPRRETAGKSQKQTEGAEETSPQSGTRAKASQCGQPKHPEYMSKWLWFERKAAPRKESQGENHVEHPSPRERGRGSDNYVRAEKHPSITRGSRGKRSWISLFLVW